MTDTQTLTRAIGNAAVPAAGTYHIDLAHSTVSFVARHMMVSKVRGHFSEFAGEIVVADDPLASSVRATIETASVETNEDKRDAHLRSPDFFDVERFPQITFASRRIVPSGDGWTVEGELTIHGVTRSVDLALEFNGAVTDPYGGTRVGFTASTEVNREDFDMTFNAVLEGGGVVVSKTVKIELEVEAILAS